MIARIVDGEEFGKVNNPIKYLRTREYVKMDFLKAFEMLLSVASTKLYVNFDVIDTSFCYLPWLHEIENDDYMDVVDDSANVTDRDNLLGEAKVDELKKLSTKEFCFLLHQNISRSSYNNIRKLLKNQTADEINILSQTELKAQRPKME